MQGDFLAQPRQVLSDGEPPARRQERLAMTGWAIPGVQIRVVEADHKVACVLY